MVGPNKGLPGGGEEVGLPYLEAANNGHELLVRGVIFEFTVVLGFALHVRRVVCTGS